jgi:ABC-type glycerol-3-phosphate transport system permease component
MATHQSARVRVPGRRKTRWRKMPATLGKYGVLGLFAAIAGVPLIWVVITSLKTTRDVAMSPLGLPSALRWQNYVDAWVVGKFGSYFLNSIIVSVPIVVITVALSCLAGYALARLRVTGGQFIFYIFLLGLMVPFQSIMIPLFYLLRDLKLLGTYWAMILPMVAIGLPLGIFLMRAFFLGLAPELADAAKIDGCSEVGVFWRIMLPLAAPGISTLAVLQFIAAWKEFLIPLLYMQKEELRPLVLGLMFFKTAYTRDIPLTMAATGIVMLPIIGVYLALQRKFIQGLTAGAVKG